MIKYLLSTILSLTFLFLLNCRAQQITPDDSVKNKQAVINSTGPSSGALKKNNLYKEPVDSISYYLIYIESAENKAHWMETSPGQCESEKQKNQLVEFKLKAAWAKQRVIYLQQQAK